jgi:hypothetical protein
LLLAAHINQMREGDVLLSGTGSAGSVACTRTSLRSPS